MTTTKTSQDPAMPLVNLNGTGIEELIVQTLSVHRAAVRLRELLSQAKPHGRDYPHNSHDIAKAADAWQETADGAVTAVRWAEKRLYDLSRQNMEHHDGSKAAQIIMAAERRVDEIMSRKRNV